MRNKANNWTSLWCNLPLWLYLCNDLATAVNSLRPRQNGRHFADDIFKCIFLDENVSIPIKISLKLVPKGPINNIPALVQIMAWCHPGDKPLSEPMMVGLPTHICVDRPQWVYSLSPGACLNIETVFPGIGIPDRLIFIMEISISVRWDLYIEVIPWWLIYHHWLL